MINIDGVEVLDFYPIDSIQPWAIAVMIVLAIITVLWLILIVESHNLKKWTEIAFFVLFSICITFWICGVVGMFNYDTGRNTYKCLIEDDVSLNEIYESYEVVSKDGKIWTLRDLED